MPINDKYWIIVLICAIVFSLIAIETDFSNPLEPSSPMDLIGMATSPISPLFSTPVSTFSAPSSITFTTTDTSKPLTFSVSDDAVYKTGYISIDGNSWQATTLTGTLLGGNWFKGSTTGTVNILKNQIGTGNNTNNYIIIYTCTKGTSWNCHDNKWQIKDFTTIKQEALSYLSVDYLKVFSSTAGDNDYFMITSNTAWTISSSPSWVTLSKTSGSGNDNVTVTVSANTGTQRTGTITITGTGVQPASLTVKQSAGTTCTDTCSSKGFNCETQTICSTNVNCGTCTSTQTCTVGKCITIVQPPGTGKTYYLAPNGNDQTGDGSISKPWFTFTRAWNTIAAGDTLYLRGGTYTYSTKQTLRNRNGAVGNMINIWAHPGETPILTDTTNFDEGSWPQALILFTGDYFYWKGLEISYVEQRPDGTGAGAMVVQDGDNNIFELFNVHHNENGFRIGASSTGNLVLNSDFHHNNDPYTAYENADGVAFDFTNAGVTNTLRGCRMWWNSDDGLDLYKGEGNVIVENCWTWYNGFAPDTFNNGGDGNGFKLGDTFTDLPTTVLRTVTNSIAYRNKLWGFQDNAAQCNIKLYNNIAYQNCYMHYKSWCGGFTFTYSGVPYYISNNIAYDNDPGSEYDIRLSTNVKSNSWNGGVSVNDADFVSLDASQLSRPRKADGSLPDITFLHLAPSSDLIDAGVNVGLPYSGSAPDIGAFETN